MLSITCAVLVLTSVCLPQTVRTFKNLGQCKAAAIEPHSGGAISDLSLSIGIIDTVLLWARTHFAKPAIAKEKRDVEFIYSDLSIDFCHCGICSSCKAVKELASAGWILLGADVGIVGRSAGFGAARLLGFPAAGRIIRSVFMSASVKRMLFVTVGMVISFTASAFDLNGAWTADESNCAKVFVMKNNKLTMTRNSGVYGGGFIVEGNQIRGQAKACKITSRKEEGGVLRLIASCTTDIAVLGMEEVNAKIESDNQITRIYPSFPEMGISFYRCKL